ncbi:hypothetical protein QSJ19_01495 [Gordonia sp. ABSL11-1]|uniref:hypothetical protein n=1 Tax=Gordonia sp. ABSL11-1 TaxID=3053924 RepID=UPI00257248DE|nr:hypothetical protein [Gordonia sp. ABSL11-1]MDL9944277.1 hypothetical protein [Gordonia sp. ABSL11-1]
MTEEQFEEVSRTCEIYTGRPWDGTIEQLYASQARQVEIHDILQAHVDWLSDIKARVEESGQRWNTVSCRSRSRRDGDLGAPPEWIGELSERLTPEWMLNR